MALGDLGGFFAGDPLANRFGKRADDNLELLLAGGNAQQARQAATNAATRAVQGTAQAMTGNPALAARQAAQAGAQASAAGQFQALQMEQQARMAGMQEAQRRAERERARVGNAVGALLGMAGSVGSMLIPGGQAAGAAGLAGQATGALGLGGSRARPGFSTDQDPLRRGAPWVETDIELERLFGGR